MANRRMFSADVVCTDRFVEMPSSTQALYFQLGMKADDDGFISSPKQITRMVGAAEDDLKLLAAKSDKERQIYSYEMFGRNEAVEYF